MVRLPLLFVVTLLLAGCGGSPPAPEVGARAETVDASRAAAAALEGESLEGGRLSLADFRGTPVFVNVWASW